MPVPSSTTVTLCGKWAYTKRILYSKPCDASHTHRTRHQRPGIRTHARTETTHVTATTRIAHLGHARHHVADVRHDSSHDRTRLTVAKEHLDKHRLVLDEHVERLVLEGARQRAARARHRHCARARARTPHAAPKEHPNTPLARVSRGSTHTHTARQRRAPARPLDAVARHGATARHATKDFSRVFFFSLGSVPPPTTGRRSAAARPRRRPRVSRSPPSGMATLRLSLISFICAHTKRKLVSQATQQKRRRARLRPSSTTRRV